MEMKKKKVRVSILISYKIHFKTKTVTTNFPGGLAVKNPPAMQEALEMWDSSLGGEDPLEEELATHSSILSWRIPWTEEPGRLQTIWSQRVRID